MNKFSIAPWKTAHSHSHEYIRDIKDAQGEIIAQVCDLEKESDESAANARLIAAAPALYSALAELHLAVTMRPSGGLSQRERAALDSARDAIARVRNDQTVTA